MLTLFLGPELHPFPPSQVEPEAAIGWAQRHRWFWGLVVKELHGGGTLPLGRRFRVEFGRVRVWSLDVCRGFRSLGLSLEVRIRVWSLGAWSRKGSGAGLGSIGSGVLDTGCTGSAVH